MSQKPDTVEQIGSTASIDLHFRQALQSIARDPRFSSPELQDVFEHITQTTAQVLECQRVSIWHYEQNPDGRFISCQTLFDAATGTSSEGGLLTESEASSYLNALEAESLLVIDDATSDPRCDELNETYLPDNGITSMLDAPFVSGGKLEGVIRLEHVGQARHWSVSEQNFCANMANLITIAIERNHRRRTESHLRDAEDRYRNLIEGLPNGVVIIVKNQIVYANNTAAELTQFDSPDMLVGKAIEDVFNVKDFDQLKGWLLGNHPDQRSRPTEYRMTLWNGQTVTFEITASSASWSGDTAIQVSLRDTTDVSYAQQRLKRSERLLSEAQRIARMGSWVWDLEKDRTECSLGLRRILGLKGNPLALPIASLAHPEDAPRLNAALNAAVEKQESYEITYRVVTDSGVLWLEENGVPELASNQKVARIHGTSRDITRQKLAEKNAKATEGRFTALGNSFPGGLFYCDVSTRFLFINDRFANWFEINVDNYLGKPIAALIGEQAYNEVESEVNRVLAGRSITFEREADFKHPGIEALQYTLAPDLDTHGGMHGFFGLVTDITELRQVERALRQAQKMDAMGQLTGGIAHDFNNILAILMGNLELARSTTVDDESKEYITAALQGVERGVSITQKLLGFARSNSKGAESLRIDHLISNSLDMIRQSVGGSVDVKITGETDLWETSIDSGDFQDAIINLSINARDAMPDGGRLEITTENRRLDDTAQRIHPNLKAGDYVLLSVTDTGTGMDANIKDKLFEPFFSTKPEGKGTGLGMSMVFGFVTRSKGEILVYSARGEGTTIHIYLPRSQSIESNEVLQPKQFSAGQVRESILIVDDEEMVGRVAEGILKELGYKTQLVTTTDEALELLKSNRFDLLFSDVVMPENLNGFELAQAALKVQPSIKIQLTSGFSKFRNMEPDDDNSKKLAENILQKPYNRTELEQAVRRALNQY